MIFVNPVLRDKHISRVFKYMANVWFDYNDEAFRSTKNRYGDPDQFSNHPSMLWTYIDHIQELHGAELIVLFVNNAVDIPYSVHANADMVIYHNSASGTYKILIDRLGDYASDTQHSANFIAHILQEYSWGGSRANY